MVIYCLLTSVFAATLMSGFTRVIQDKKMPGDHDPLRDNWGVKWRAFFKHMDMNGDGKMDENEYVNMTAATVGTITKSAEKEEKMRAFLKENWERWWKSFMKDASFGISADDFISTEPKTREKMVDIQHLVMEVKWALMLFELVDVDVNDSLNETEYGNYLEIFRAPFSPDIFYEADSNSDGSIDKSEMVINELSWTISKSTDGADFYGKVL
ncbi:uncharacterized protein LOC106162170 [Lingula anatina]|uniref:Uncharacterized protein LOC106162170 n=1 Tax=Lingula anatina TaxID=7574 RepID=A0A1S3I966_LINAN|nr:uncharacterized protein LOC106162170 [Lingula anatina]|eukprot:XP_013394805.1 uncharacterized protein LOC106162170 [Lingula anatina]